MSKEKSDFNKTNQSLSVKEDESIQMLVTNLKDNNSEQSEILEWVNGLKDPNTRVMSLVQLSKKREAFSDLAIYLWYTPGVISILLQEIIETYKLLAPPNLTVQESNHTCNVLALFQCIAAHSETRPHLLNAQIPIFLYPFLNTVNKNKPFEYLRLTALGVIGALVKVDNSDVINFLLSTEIIPLCLRIMERGSELSKTVATFIVQRILLDENGLSYVCNTAERFYAVSSVLAKMIGSYASPRLVKHIVRCYARLSDNSKYFLFLFFRVSTILKENLPNIFKDKTFLNSLDESSKKWVQNLMKNLKVNPTTSTNPTQQKEINKPPVYQPFTDNVYMYNQSPYGGSFGTRYDPYYYGNYEETPIGPGSVLPMSSNMYPNGNFNNQPGNGSNFYPNYETGKKN